MTDKIGRDAFIYLAPKSRPDEHAQCGPCRMFVPEEALRNMSCGRCVIHGSSVEIDEDDSCGFFVPWPTPDGMPNPETVQDHAAELMKGIPGSVTPEESGLVDRRVQCHRCRFISGTSRCGLYETLNEVASDMFELDPNIEGHACCNAQMPKASDEEYGKMSSGERVAYARASGVKAR